MHIITRNIKENKFQMLSLDYFIPKNIFFGEFLIRLLNFSHLDSQASFNLKINAFTVSYYFLFIYMKTEIKILFPEEILKVFNVSSAIKENHFESFF